MNPKDKSIINILLENSRLSAREIAKKANISVVTVIKKMKEMEKEGIIKSYVAELDYEKLGYDVQAIINLRISKGKLFEIEKKIATIPNVSAVYDSTGDFDCLIIAKFKSRKGLDNFLKKVQTFDFVERTKTKLILNTIKEERIKIS